jgi:hypothetical protein
VTCDRSVVFPVSSTNKTDSHNNWNIVESGVKHYYPNPHPFNIILWCWCVLKRSWLGSISPYGTSFQFLYTNILFLFCISVRKTLDRIGGGMISLLVSSVLDHGFDLVQSNQRLQNWYLFVSRLAVLKGSYRLVGLMCPSEETMRTLELCNNPSVVCWSDTKRISSLLFSLTMLSICLHIGLHTFHVI